MSFHAARWDPDFDPTGKRVAVVGTDSTAGHYLGQLTAVSGLGHRFRARAAPDRRRVAVAVDPGQALATPPSGAGQAGGSRPALVASPISAITPSGIRTGDGVDHRADAIIYGTGFAIRDQASELVGAGGVSIEQAWHDGMEPFLGVAIHGFPNYFWITGPDAAAQTRYVAAMPALMDRNASTRIEVRRSSQQVFNERAHFGSRSAIPGGIGVRPVVRRPAATMRPTTAGDADDSRYVSIRCGSG